MMNQLFYHVMSSLLCLTCISLLTVWSVSLTKLRDVGPFLQNRTVYSCFDGHLTNCFRQLSCMRFAPLVLEKTFIAIFVRMLLWAVAACIDLEVDVSVVLWIAGRYMKGAIHVVCLLHMQ